MIRLYVVYLKRRITIIEIERCSMADERLTVGVEEFARMSGIYRNSTYQAVKSGQVDNLKKGNKNT